MGYNIEQLDVLIKAMGDKLHHPERKEMPKNMMVTGMEKELVALKSLDGKKQSQALEKLNDRIERFLSNLKGTGEEIKNQCAKALKTASSPPSKPLPTPPSWGEKTAARNRSNAIVRHDNSVKPTRG